MSATLLVRRHQSLLLAVTCFVVYLLLAQESGYGDGPGAILEIRAGAAFQDPIHYLYMPTILGMSTLLGWTGLSLSLFEVGYVASALGSAVGVGLLHAATRRLASQHDPLLVAVLTACCPAVVFFATVMEYHGPYFAFASLATYAMVRLVQAPRWPQAALVGFATGLAYLAHASAHLLPWFLLLCFFALAERSPAHGGWRHHLLLAAVVVVAHVAFVFLATLALQTLLGASVSSGSALGWIEAEASRPYDRLQLLPLTFWYEILWPYLLLSVTWLWGFRNPTHRPLALALLLALLAHLGMCMVLVPGY
ncbi:MAG: glycosyltransferase family 39 protein, partial [Planctomycetota bacterium]